FTYLPIIPSPSLTPSLTTHTHNPTAGRVPSITTVVGPGPRAVSYTTVYITPTPSAAAPEKPEEQHREPVYGDLTWSYVVLICVPFVFIAIALYANYRDRRRRVADEDIEMQSFQKFWFPWRELDPGEVPNEVSGSSPSSSSSSSVGPFAARGLGLKERRYAWCPSDETPMPPVTIYSDPPPWGRRHSWWEVAAYPGYPNPLTPQRRRQAAAADHDDEQIYGRTGSRRNADPEGEELAKDNDDGDDEDAASDSISVTATTGRASPNIVPESSNAVRDGGDAAKTASPNPWAAHIPSYYGDLAFPAS
ncbi:hypothetical protein LX36DRAFT_539996, partial [Colletotrichum falcatum]